MKRALIIVDVQNDFCRGGALAVGDADSSLVQEINVKMRDYAVVVATQDWHPPGHISFNGWPVHCVQGSPGAALVRSLDRRPIDLILRKGTKQDADSYSAFQDDDQQTTGLAGYLHARNVTEVHVCGLALDYCVQATAMDAARSFPTSVILRLTRSVRPELHDETCRQLEAAGVTLL